MQKLLGEALYSQITKYIYPKDITEIRIRLGKPIIVKKFDDIIVLEIIADDQLLNGIVFRATKGSKYAYESQISQGYIDYDNGIRIGITGDCNITKDNIVSIKTIYSLCIRNPHEILGCAKDISDVIDNFDNTLIISPPGCGKTTLLREAARLLSARYDVLIIDERGEVCGKDLILNRGIHCDVIQGIPKDLAYERAVRTMNPDIIVCDELFGDNDERSIIKIIASGVKVLATYHSDMDDIDFGKGIFRYKILLTDIPTVGTVKSIIKY